MQKDGFAFWRGRGGCPTICVNVGGISSALLVLESLPHSELQPAPQVEDIWLISCHPKVDAALLPSHFGSVKQCLFPINMHRAARTIPPTDHNVNQVAQSD